MNALWESLHPDVRSAAEDIARTGRFDAAIFEAFKLIEDAIQARIGSQGVGQTLLNEAFDSNPPKIDISSVPQDQNGIKSLFSGALGFIRNDRGHKRTPTIPCDSEHECLWYLHFASLLLLFLDKDRSTFPKVTGVRIHGTPESPQVELSGNNFSGSSLVMVGNDLLQIVQVTSNTIELLLPVGFSGELQVVNGTKKSIPFFCNTTFFEDIPESSYLVIETEVSLYADEHCRNLRDGVVGLVLKCSEFGGHYFQQVWPVRPSSSIRRGDYARVSQFEKNAVEQTWYIFPGTTRPEGAWLNALIATPTILGHETGFATGSVSILPNEIKLEPAERRTLRVVALGYDGPVKKECDITSAVRWKIPNQSLAYINKDGVLFAKNLGRTEFECEYSNFVAKATVDVANIPSGSSTVFFKGRRRLAQVRLDTDKNLYFCNQSQQVFSISKDGGLSIVLSLEVKPFCPYVISCLAIDDQKRLYVNDMTRSACHRFEWDGSKFVNAKQLGGRFGGQKNSIAINREGQIFIGWASSAGQGGAVIRIDPDGAETSFSTRGLPLYLALDDESRVYVPYGPATSVDVYSPDGDFIEEIIHGDTGIPGDLALDVNRTVYLAMPGKGLILRIPQSTTTAKEYIPGKFGHPTGIAIDHRGRIFVSNFAGGEIFLVH